MWQMWKLLYQSKGCLNRLDTEILHVYKWIENEQNILCVFLCLCVCPACQIYQHIIDLVTHCIYLAQKYEIKSPNPILKQTLWEGKFIESDFEEQKNSHCCDQHTNISNQNILKSYLWGTLKSYLWGTLKSYL